MQLIVVPTIHIFSDLVRHFVMRSSANCFPVNRQDFQEFQEIYSPHWTLWTFISGPKVPKSAQKSVIPFKNGGLSSMIWIKTDFDQFY